MNKEHQVIQKLYSQYQVKDLEELICSKGYSLEINKESLIGSEDYFKVYFNNKLIGLVNELHEDLSNLSQRDIIILETLAIKKEIMIKFFMVYSYMLNKENFVKNKLTLEIIANSLKSLNIQKKIITNYFPCLLNI